MSEWKDKVAVVTGAASGIGLGVTERFAAEGMKVVMADVEQAALDREVKRLSEAGAEVTGVLCDVRDYDSVLQLRDRALSQYGSVFVIFNNAGVAPAGPMLDTKPEDWKWIMDVNVMGVAHGVMAFGPLLRDQDAGHIVNTASEAGLASSAVLGMYTATKHAVLGLTESLYRELEDTHVGVHVLCPNLVKTGIFQSERNRDDGAEMRAVEVATLAPLKEAITAGGIGPDQVAGDILDAMRENRFWIFTHEITPQVAAGRFRDIEARRNPSNPYDGLELSATTEGLRDLS